MKSAITILPRLIALTLAATASAQDTSPRPPVPSQRRVFSPPSPDRSAETDLSRNYRITLSLKIGDHPIRDIEILTASAQVKATAVLGVDEATKGSSSIQISGLLSEKEDGLRFSYQLGTSVPIVTQSSSTASKPDGEKTEIRSISYVDETVSGVLLMQPGKAYGVFTSATRSYVLTVEPADAAK